MHQHGSAYLDVGRWPADGEVVASLTGDKTARTSVVVRCQQRDGKAATCFETVDRAVRRDMQQGGGLLIVV
jgi:hypothetical protein